MAPSIGGWLFMTDLSWALGFLLILYKDGRRCVTMGVVGKFS
jgi:hypothetical protein